MSSEKNFSAALRDWNAALGGEIEQLAERHLLRRLRTGAGVDFTSNDYLSLNASGRLTGLLKTLAADWSGPAGSTGSRLLRGHADIFEETENAFTALTGQASALLFHSGYAANLGVIPALIGGRDQVFCDRLCHASLLDGIRLSGAKRTYYDHDDLNDLSAKLNKVSPRPGGRAWIISETVFSMDGDRPDLRALVEVAESAGALVYLDEAHAVGLHGPGGAGRVAEAGLCERVAVSVYPCGKAPGLMGAFVCGPAELKPYLVNRCRSFIYSTAQPPLLAALLKTVIELLPSPEMDGARQRVFIRAHELRQRLSQAGIETLGDSQIVPVVAGSEERALAWMDACRQAGLDVRAIRPPSVPPGSSRLRITIQAAHETRHIERLAAVLAND